MHQLARLAAALRAIAIVSLICSSAVPAAAQSTVTPLAGTVIDSATGLPLANATIATSGPTTSTTTANRDGRFSFPTLGPGVYTLTARADGYAPAASDAITIFAGSSANVTLNLQRVAVGNNNLRTIGHTTTRASASLQKASVLYQQVNAEQVTEQGLYRLGDALRQLPGIVNGGSDTAAPADDINLNFRGIGNLETLTLVDGHPVGYGLRNPYNFDISPAALFRDVISVYGSGADQFYPLNSIGGVFDFQTINPTPTAKESLTQQVGTFGQVSSFVTATGTFDNVGYAFAAGAQGLDGPLRHQSNLYNFSASQDPGATDALRNTAFYDVDESTNTHTLSGKLVFPIAKETKLMVSALTESFYDNKTGNGDLDYLPYDVAFGSAQATASAPNTYNLYAYTPGTGAPSKTDTVVTCPTGYLPLTNGAGVPSATYTQNTIGLVQAVPGAGTIRTACVTPTQYASVNSGLNGAGAAFQTYNLQDYHARLTQENDKHQFYVDGYVDNYVHHYNRDLQLPYGDVPGDNPGSYYEGVVNTGLTVGNTWTSAHNSTGLGLYYNNASYNDYQSPGPINVTAAVKNDFSAFFREAYTFPTLPLTLYGNLWQKNAGETNTSFLDPRVAAVVTLKNDVFRLSAGQSSTQPYIAAIDAPFTPIALGSLNGNVSNAPGGSCSQAATSPISIGSGGSGPGLKPERGVDTELSYGHRFFGDSQIQATFYNTNVYNKIYSTTAPFSIVGLGGIDAAFLAQASQVVRNICGQGFDVIGGLGVSSAVNLGQLRAQGIEITGRQRVIRQVALDYDYGVDSVKLVSAPPSLLSSSGTLIVGSQLPNVPLHQYNLGLNYEFVRNANFRLGYHHVSNNNTKNLPAYGYADAQVVGPVGPGRLAIAVNNLFSSQAFPYGYISQGVPLSTNSFAGGVPSQQERFGLPYRTINFTYTLLTR